MSDDDMVEWPAMAARQFYRLIEDGLNSHGPIEFVDGPWEKWAGRRPRCWKEQAEAKWRVARVASEVGPRRLARITLEETQRMAGSSGSVVCGRPRARGWPALLSGPKRPGEVSIRRMMSGWSSTKR